MTAAPPNIPDIDLELIPVQVRAAVKALLDLVHVLLAENRLLRGKVDLMVRRYFGGQKNESLSPEQLQLLLQGFTTELLAARAELDPQPRPASTPPTRKPVRTGVPEHLPLRSSQVLVPQEVQDSPGLFREIDRDVTSILDYEPGRFVRDEIIRPRFVRKERITTPAIESAVGTTSAPVSPVELEVIASPLPNRLIEKGLPGVGLLTHLIISRFDDHLPFYRLQKGFQERHQLQLSRQTMVGWTESIAEWFRPLVERIKERMFLKGYLQVDETPIKYLDRDEPGKSQQGYFWVYAEPGGDVVSDWQTTRGADAPREFLKGFEGCLQCDGYGVYGAIAAEQPKWQLYYCVAHWRRKFIEAKDEDRRAGWFLLQMRHLYEIERRLRDQKASAKERERTRAVESRPIWERMRRYLERIESKVLPASRLGKALGYGKNLWEGLSRHLIDGRVEIDSNLVENAIRPTAVGKKSFLFIGHPDAGWRSAVMYTLIGSCRRRRINPELYLRDVLTKLPDMKTSELEQYTPEAWIQRHPEARIQLPK